LHVTQLSDNKILLTSYYNVTRSTVFTCLDNNFSVLWTKSYSVIEDSEEKVIFHLTRRGQIFPFISGEIKNETENYYYANGFYNFSFSLLFLNASTGNMTGAINGFRYEAGISNLIQRDTTEYLLSRFDEDQNFINTDPTFRFTAIGSIDEIEGIYWAEIAPNAPVKMINTTINGKKTTVYGTHTRSNQILLLFFDSESGKLLNSKYLGSTFQVKLASLIATSDGGIGVLAQTQVAGRFPRIQLIKIPSESL